MGASLAGRSAATGPCAQLTDGVAFALECPSSASVSTHGLQGPGRHAAVLTVFGERGCWRQNVRVWFSFLPSWKPRGLTPVAPPKASLEHWAPSDAREAWMDCRVTGSHRHHRARGPRAGPGLDSRTPWAGAASVCIGGGAGQAQSRLAAASGLWAAGVGEGGGPAGSRTGCRLPGSQPPGPTAGARGRPCTEPSLLGRRTLAWLQTQTSPPGPRGGSGRAGSRPRMRHNPPFVPVAAWSLRAKRK